MKILGIETSCDETAASVVQGGNNQVRVISNVVASQIDIHKKYGGVVPEVAAREHVLKILPVVNEALVQANIKNAKDEITAIAVATGPGLITSLLVGTETAKTLSYAWNIPVISINHVEGHLYANFINRKNIELPAIVLTVSGGHTMLVLMESHEKLSTLGETRDDAAGEAFDKAASLMELGYPGGPAISAEAEKINPIQTSSDITLPRPMIDKPGFDFSFSGLKTALLYTLQDDKNWRERIPEYAHEFQQAIIDVLIEKTINAAKEREVKTVMLSGGVAANKELREQLSARVKETLIGVNFLMPDLKYTTDNAAMIATAGIFKAMRQKFTPWQELKVDCSLEI
jgi:N6-L-threonylcarbamoyladenine synthase